MEHWAQAQADFEYDVSIPRKGLGLMEHPIISPWSLSMRVSIPRKGLGLMELKSFSGKVSDYNVSIPRKGLGLMELERCCPLTVSGLFQSLERG